ncbi:MAG TPA: acetyltransferase [Oscillatoriaceae cyanobacterium]
MAKLVIFGAGDIARLAHYYFSTDSEHEVVAFTVDAGYRQSDNFLHLPLIDFNRVREYFPSNRYKMFVALSYARMNRAREEKYHSVKALGYELVSYVSSRCTYLAPEPPGNNGFILEDCTIQPFVTIGANVTLWSGSHVGHDSVVGDHVFVAPHAAISGHVTIGPNCFVGVNATLRNGITLAPATLVGAGAVIQNDTIEKGVYGAPRVCLLEKSSDEVSP